MDPERRKLAAFVAAGLSLPGGLACQESEVDGTLVEHTTPDGKTLAGTYLRPETSTVVGTLILLHEPGPGGDRHQFDEIWDALVGQGLGLLAPDLRSHGRSDSGGPWQDLALDPSGYPVDVTGWLDFIQFREEEGDMVDRDRVGILGLGTSGSLGAAALGKGQVACLVAVSPSIEEVNALAPGFEPYAPGDDDDGGGDDDDDSAEARGGGDDDDDDSASTGDDDDGGPPDIDPELALHDASWMFGAADQPSATDAPALYEATAGERELFQVDGSEHGVEILWLSDETKDAMVTWCAGLL